MAAGPYSIDPTTGLTPVWWNVTVADHSLAEGDVLRVEDAETLTVEGSGEVLAWAMECGI